MKEVVFIISKSKTIVSIWGEDMLGYLSADIICSEKRTIFRERSSRKAVSFEEQIMSKGKYPSIFSPQMGTIVFIILQILCATRALLKSRGNSRISPSFYIRSRDLCRAIAVERKDLMDYNYYSTNCNTIQIWS